MFSQPSLIDHGSLWLMFYTNKFYASVEATFNATDCFTSGLCPSDDPAELSDTLEHTDFIDMLNALQESLKKPMNESVGFYKSSRVKGDISRGFVTFSLDYSKIAIVLAVYIVLAIAILVLHCNRKRLAIEYDFKFSTLSKSIFKYLVLKVVTTIVHFIVLFLYTRQYFKYGIIYFVAKPVSIWNYALSVVSFALVALFALGYGTKRFTINRLMWIKTILLSTGYLIHTFKSLIEQLDEMSQYWERKVAVYHKVTIGVMFVAVVTTTLYFGYSTYKIDKDPRFLKSAYIILGAFLLNPFITVPQQSFRKFFVATIVGATRERYWGGAHIPEVLELGVLVSLVYIWRDIREEEEDGVGLGSIRLPESSA